MPYLGIERFNKGKRQITCKFKYKFTEIPIKLPGCIGRHG
jgi:hypothetical protein